MTEARHHRFHPWAVLRLRCPECGEGPIFAGPLRMNGRCSTCGLEFEREPSGYFTGAMYFSYALGIPIVAALTFAGTRLLPGWSLPCVILLAWLAFLPFAPAVFRYSRVLFIHLDRALDPEP